MKIISILLFAISINLDNLPLSLLLLHQNQSLSFKENFWLSLFVSISTYLIMILSIHFSTFFIPEILVELSCASLIIIGMLSIYHALFQIKKEKKTKKTIIKLALSLLSNNIFAAIPAAIAGTPVFYSAIFNFIACLFFLEIAKIITCKSDLKRELLFVSGLFFILLGILELYY